MDDTREQQLAAVKTRLAELATKFIERTRGDLQIMRAELAKAGAGEVAALAEIRLLAHRMSGTGATLGFDALGARAASAEKLIDTLPAGVVPDGATLARLAAEIGAIESQLASEAAKPR